MTIYTVEFNRGSVRNWTVAFKELAHARKFSQNDYTDKVKVHNFKNMDRAEDFIRNKCSFADFAENETCEEMQIIRKMAGIN